MKKVNKFVALSLVIISVLAISVPALAATAWEERYGPGELYSNTDYPGVNHDIMRLQTDLMSLGYDLGPDGADGYYGDYTKAAVRSFQNRNGLVADGIAGPVTKALLYRQTH